MTALGPGGSRDGELPRAFETPREFAAYYYVAPTLLPWSHRRLNLLGAGIAIGMAIDGLRPTCARFTASDVRDAGDCVADDQHGHIPTALFLAHGAYPIPGTDRPTEYANPEYIHRHAASGLERVTDPAKRRAWLRRYARLGSVVAPETIAAHFGLAEQFDVAGETAGDWSPSAIRMVADVLGEPFESRRAAGDAHMGRVFAITLRWMDTTPSAIARAYATTTRHVTCLLAEVARDGFTPPPEPPRVSGGFGEDVDGSAG